MIVGGLEEIRADEEARELYVVDNYMNGRVLVFDKDTLELKRGWGAYGKPSERDPREGPRYRITSDPPAGPDFFGHVTLDLSNDGLVYVADRRGNRIQVLTKQGEFLEEFYPRDEHATARLDRRYRVLGRPGATLLARSPTFRTTRFISWIRDDGVEELGRVGTPGQQRRPVSRAAHAGRRLGRQSLHGRGASRRARAAILAWSPTEAAGRPAG